MGATVTLLDKVFPCDHGHWKLVYWMDKNRAVVMCGNPDCHELRIGDNVNKLRELTPKEQTDATIKMMEDIAFGQAFRIIHGPKGPEMYLERTGR